MPILLSILVFLLSGCHAITHYPQPQPPVVTKSTVDEVTVKVTWVQNVDQLSEVCAMPNRIIYGCAYVYRISGNHYCKIWVIEPRDFDDIPKLAMLGHEFWHCLGARHQSR